MKTKTIYLDEQEVQCIRLVVKQSNDGWVTVSESDIANAPAHSCKIYVDVQEGAQQEVGTAGS